MEIQPRPSMTPYTGVSKNFRIQSPVANVRKSLFKGVTSPGAPVGGKTPYLSRLERKFNNYDPDREPVKTFLRIRPGPNRNLLTSLPTSYLDLVNDHEVIMTPPTDSTAYKARCGIQERFKFTKVFNEDTTQNDFFLETARPLISQVMNGENALIFAYGVSNSGKTYTIQGSRENPGLLPRTLELMLNSIQGKQSTDTLRPARYCEIESCQSSEEFQSNQFSSAQAQLEESFDKIECDPEYEYAVWVSYAEIYNEKVYDLLDPGLVNDSKRKFLTLKKDRKTGYKYIPGLRELKVNSVEDGYQILNQGQNNRTVFSTLLNAVSSRSHSIFTIKLIRIPKNAMTEDLKIKYSSVSRISLVDLAGAERSKLTNNTGERLKEANNINKSLMVLGQCLESLRHNQTREHKEVVPFRQSKLTEIFQSSFTGEAKAVMLVNVNPYETSFAETSHVLKFAAVAMDITTVKRTVQKLKISKLLEMESDLETPTKPSKRASFDSDFVSEEDDEVEYESEEEDVYIADMVKKYEDILHEIRDKWLDAESRCANMEAEIREELTNEFAERVKRLESMFSSRLTNENEMNEFKTEKKIDILSRNQTHVEFLAAGNDQDDEEKVIQLCHELDQQKAILIAQENNIRELEFDLAASHGLVAAEKSQKMVLYEKLQDLEESIPTEVDHAVQEALAKQSKEYSQKYAQLQASFNKLQMEYTEVENHLKEIVCENLELKKEFDKDKAYLEHKNTKLLEIASTSIHQQDKVSTEEARPPQVTPTKPKPNAFMHTTPDSKANNTTAPSTAVLSKSEVKSGFLKKYLWGKKKLAYDSYEAVSVDPASEDTTVVKGPIIKSPTGGVQVVFTDIETYHGDEAESSASPAVQALRMQNEKTPLSPFIKKARGLFRKTPSTSVTTTNHDDIFGDNTQLKKKTRKLRSKKVVTEQEINNNVLSIEQDSRTPMKSRLRQRNDIKLDY
ncbi:hypothetical protein K7432_013170 [Basidiobolus ranarum]|uniref:Kinesin-like protein n=1 Tax=Basidiobolus ranarum TaxID=34480 RepID=A0ABR2VRE6_9FUNG